jgi:predicted KAP-like P-loop ATPase
MKSDKLFSYIDVLDSYEFIDEIEIIRKIESFLSEPNEEGIMISIKGGWGSGKTSTLRLLENYFQNYHGWNTVFYEAWKYHNEANPLIPLLNVMSEKLSEEKLKKLAVRSLGRYVGNIDEIILKTGLGLLGIKPGDVDKIKKEIKAVMDIAG